MKITRTQLDNYIEKKVKQYIFESHMKEGGEGSGIKGHTTNRPEAAVRDNEKIVVRNGEKYVQTTPRHRFHLREKDIDNAANILKKAKIKFDIGWKSGGRTIQPANSKDNDKMKELLKSKAFRISNRIPSETPFDIYKKYKAK